ncbi:DUF2189 domain-containing protein [Skermanella mucosa]|uniref:DUF2189 domain-containing protein n=1 Tax=Skermanella mucosa TaxID=1789672 RepID=UPI00192C9118|nr:DUF2189 domain-containing protein [Skermanella mucosa]UEM18788.1 DUF2189 domain-containing protein [Skermanella mucosa]
MAYGEAYPVVRKIGLNDIRDALGKGVEDFLATPTQLIFLGVIYPLVGLVAARWAYGADLRPLLYPLIAGLTLMGPVAAIGIYELSRRREQGKSASWLHAFDVLKSPAIGSIMVLALGLAALFVAWLAAASAIYEATLGTSMAAPEDGFLYRVFNTAEGWQMIFLGNLVGFLFAVVVLATSVVSFPLLLDRDVGPVAAVKTSLRAVAANPVPMAAWGLVVALSIAVGSLPFFVGLAVVMPILGHATWHLYRRVVEN